MDHGEAVDKNGHVVAGVVRSGLLLILVDDLQAIVVDVLLVKQSDVFG